MQTEIHTAPFRGPRDSEDFNFLQLQAINDMQKLYYIYNNSQYTNNLISDIIYQNNTILIPSTLCDVNSLRNKINTASEIAENNIFGFVS